MSQTKSDEANLNEKSKSSGTGTGSSGSKQNVHIKQCKLRRTRFVNKNFLPSKSSIGGGIKFRDSHIPIQQNSRISKTLMSRIKPNDLSDIESIDSDEEQDTSKS